MMYPIFCLAAQNNSTGLKYYHDFGTLPSKVSNIAQDLRTLSQIMNGNQPVPCKVEGGFFIRDLVPYDNLAVREVKEEPEEKKETDNYLTEREKILRVNEIIKQWCLMRPEDA